MHDHAVVNAELIVRLCYSDLPNLSPTPVHYLACNMLIETNSLVEKYPGSLSVFSTVPDAVSCVVLL